MSKLEITWFVLFLQEANHLKPQEKGLSMSIYMSSHEILAGSFPGYPQKIPSSLHQPLGLGASAIRTSLSWPRPSFNSSNARRFPSTFSSFRHGGTPPQCGWFFYPSTKTQPPSRDKKAGSDQPLGKMLKVDQNVPLGSSGAKTEKFHRSEISTGQLANSVLIEKLSHGNHRMGSEPCW